LWKESKNMSKQQLSTIGSFLACPFRWVQNTYKKAASWLVRPGVPTDTWFGRVRNFAAKHPIVSLTTLFCSTVALTLLTGIWWLGGSIFILAIVLFSGSNVLSGVFKTTTIAFELLLAAILFFMLSAMVVPVASYWLLYLLAPIVFLLLRAGHDAIVFTNFAFEIGSLTDDSGDTYNETA
jgi:hypothetical protein